MTIIEQIELAVRRAQDRLGHTHFSREGHLILGALADELLRTDLEQDHPIQSGRTDRT